MSGVEFSWPRPDDWNERLTREQLVTVSLVIGFHVHHSIVERTLQELGLVKGVSRYCWHPKVMQYQSWATNEVVLEKANGKTNES